MVSGLTPAKVFTFAGHSDKTGADIYDAITILCENGATVTVSGVASIPGCCKVIENRLIGSEGILAYCGKVRLATLCTWSPACPHAPNVLHAG